MTSRVEYKFNCNIIAATTTLMNTVFPATYSTLSAPMLAAYIASKYALSQVHCQLITKGVGDTYLVIAENNRYVFRVCRTQQRNLAQVQEETTVLLALHQAGIAVAYPVPDVQGSYIQTLTAIEGERQAVLFSYAPGNSVRTLTPPQVQALGVQMARFHTIASTIPTSKSRWTFDTATTLFTPLQRLQPYFTDLSEEYTWLTQAAEQAANLLHHTDATLFATGYCHFDFLPKNFHFNGDAITLFDFDFMGYGWQVNDLMSYWQHLQLEVYAGRMKQEEADHLFTLLVAAYREQKPLSDAELATIPYLALGFWLFYMGFHTTHDQFYSFLQPVTLKVYIGFLQHLVKQHWNEK